MPGATPGTLACVDFPISKTLTAAGQKDAYCVIRTDDAPPYFEETLHEFHGFDVGHGAQDRSTKPLTGQKRLSTSRLQLQRFGHSHLQGNGWHLPRELNPMRPLARTFDCRRNNTCLGEPHVRDRSSDDGAFRRRNLTEHPANGQALVDGAPGGKRQDVAKIVFLTLIRPVVVVTQLTPVAARMDFPRELARQDAIRFGPLPQLPEHQVDRLRALWPDELREEARHRQAGIGDLSGEPARRAMHER